MFMLMLNLAYMRLKIWEVLRTNDVSTVVYRADKVAKHYNLKKVEAGYTYITYHMTVISNPEKYPIYFNIPDETFVKGYK